MTIRRYRESDRAALEKLSAGQDFDYPAPDSPLLETFWVACDDNDQPLMSIEAHRMVELYFRLSPDIPHVAALNAGAELLRNVKVDLCENGYHDAEGFLSPRIEHSFGRHLIKHFGAIRNWASVKFRF